jgi:predicted MFS family arabinose efflux permease
LVNPLSALRDRRLLLLSVVATLLTSQFYQAYSTLPLVMAGLGLTESAYGYAIAANGVTVVGLTIFLSRALQRWQPRTALVAASLLVGIGFALNQFADRLEYFMVAIVILTLGEIAMSSVMPSLISNLAPPDQRGTYQGTHAMAWGVGGLAGPAIGGFLLQHGGNSLLWNVCGLAGVMAALGFWGIKFDSPAQFPAPVAPTRSQSLPGDVGV